MQAVAAGLEQQHGLPVGSAAVGFAVASDLQASADFDSLCHEDADSGILLLHSHVAIRWDAWPGRAGLGWAAWQGARSAAGSWEREPWARPGCCVPA